MSIAVTFCFEDKGTEECAALWCMFPLLLEVQAALYLHCHCETLRRRALTQTVAAQVLVTGWV